MSNVEFRNQQEAVCPYCKGRVVIGETRERGPAMVHDGEGCERFNRESVTDTLRAMLRAKGVTRVR